MQTVRKMDVLPGTIINKAIQRAIAEAGEDVVEFEFNGVILQVEADSDPDAKHREWHETMDANCQRLIAEKNRREHPERYWDATVPAEPGWYWWRRRTGAEPLVLWVTHRPGGTMRAWKSAGWHSFEDLGGQWAGPIALPID